MQAPVVVWIGLKMWLGVIEMFLQTKAPGDKQNGVPSQSLLSDASCVLSEVASQKYGAPIKGDSQTSRHVRDVTSKRLV